MEQRSWRWPAVGAAVLASAVLAASFTERELHSVYYADLGPEEVDVSAYPPEQQRNYEVFRRVCSECHTTARALNSQVATRESWRAYLSEMRLRRTLRRKGPLTEEETKAVLDFLEYDGKKRKLERREEFDAQSRVLQKRFWETVEERMQRLQQSPLPRP